MSDLLNCPFCGGDADLDFWWNENGDSGCGKVICIDCGTEMAGSDHSRPITAVEKAASKSEAVAFWNRRALPAVQPDAVIRAERDRCIRIVKQLQKEAAERGWGDRDTQTRRIVSAIRHEIVGEALPAVQPVTVRLVFANADATPKTTVLDVSAEAVPDIMAWYGAYFAGDRYTVTVDGRNVPMDQNGEPTKGKRND